MPKLSPLINASALVKGALVKAVVNAGVAPARTKVLKDPAAHGLPFSCVDIEASDGVRLSAWLIERADTKKVAVVNHPLMCTRYGTAKGVDNVPVEFIPMLKHLYTAGFTVISYDQRGQGESDGGLGDKQLGPTECPCGAGAEEWKDVVGVLSYVRANYPEHEVALVGQCMGANSIFKSFTEAPEAFEGVNVKCMVALQPTRSSNMRGRMTKAMVGVDLAEDASALQLHTYGFTGVDCVEHAPGLPFPILLAQNAGDVYARDEETNDVQAIYDACPEGAKQLLWFGPGTDHPFGNGLRFEGYSFFNYHPQPLVEFLNTYTGGASPPPQDIADVSAEVTMERDEDHATCQECAAVFGMMKRRHHCRCCGRVLCHGCSNKRVNGERACVGCWVHAEVEQMAHAGGNAPPTKFETSVEIDAPASTVWQVLTDFDQTPQWCSSLQGLKGEFKEGGAVVITFNFMGLKFDVPHHVRDFEEGVQWRWGDEIDHGITNNHLYRVEAIDETHSRFINNDELTGGEEVVRYGVLRSMEASYQQFNAELKQHVESSAQETVESAV